MTWLTGTNIRHMNIVNGDHFDGYLWIMLDDADFLEDDLHLRMETLFEVEMSIQYEPPVRYIFNVPDDPAPRYWDE